MLDCLSQQNQIEIESSWSTGIRTLSPVGQFDLEESIEHLSSVERRFTDGHRIQISRLILQSFPFGFGFDESGNCEARDELGESIDGTPERGFAVTEV